MYIDTKNFRDLAESSHTNYGSIHVDLNRLWFIESHEHDIQLAMGNGRSHSRKLCGPTNISLSRVFRPLHGFFQKTDN